MRGEMIITETDLVSRFRGERDLITYAPYQVGDRVVRCSHCKAVVKSEFVNHCCPLCSCTPFTPAPVDPAQQRIIPSHTVRSLTTFFWILLLSVVATYIPFAFPGAVVFLDEASLGIGLSTLLISIGVISLITATVLYFNKSTRRFWQDSGWGCFLALAPVSAPYLVLASLWAVAFALAIAAAIACIALIILIISCFLQ